MKLIDRVKKIIYKRVFNHLLFYNTEEEINEAILFLRLWNDNSRVIPYGLFEEDSLINHSDILISYQGDIFKHWLLSNTGSIEKPFNKSRKIARKIKELETKLSTTDIPIHVNTVLPSLFGVFFVDLSAKVGFINFTFSDESRIQDVLRDISIALALILYIDSTVDTDKIDQLLDLCINVPDRTLFNKMLEIAHQTEFAEPLDIL